MASSTVANTTRQPPAQAEKAHDPIVSAAGGNTRPLHASHSPGLLTLRPEVHACTPLFDSVRFRTDTLRQCVRAVVYRVSAGGVQASEIPWVGGTTLRLQAPPAFRFLLANVAVRQTGNLVAVAPGQLCLF